MWRNSDTYRAIGENISHALLLVDEGYGLAPWLRNPATQEQQSYNKLHYRERNN
jgi:hypothetical protein